MLRMSALLGVLISSLAVLATGRTLRHVVDVPPQRPMHLAVGSSSSPTAARLVGLFRSPSNFQSCNLLRINPVDGTNVTLTSAVSACSALSTTYPAFSALLPNRKQLAVAIASAPAIYAYDVNTGAESLVAPLPAYNNSDPYVGLVSLPSGLLLLVTQYHIYNVVNGNLTLLASVNLPASSVVTTVPGGGVAGKGQLLIADESSTVLYVIDLANPGVATHVATSVSRPMDLQYSIANKLAIELASYQLFTVDVASGASTKVMDIPNGPGFPRVNGLSTDGTIFWFMDFGTMYTISLANYTILTKATFTATPRVMAFPAWIDV